MSPSRQIRTLPVVGSWDLRAGVREYLGGVELRGKRVLDVGTASGFLAFWMERAGAHVVAYDLSEGQDWDVVPFAGSDVEAERAARKTHIRQLNNSFRFARGALDSKVKLAHGSVYAFPEGIGPFDVAVFGSILLHLQDPFRALQGALSLTKELVIVTDVLPRRSLLVPFLARWFGPCLHFLPDAAAQGPKDSWFLLTPRAVIRMIGVLGFTDCRLSFHTQLYDGKPCRLFTVVGRRTVPL
ncbi:MAG: methyltransferase domain-containing protein [Thermoanaerobaculaceae bacterium]